MPSSQGAKQPFRYRKRRQWQCKAAAMPENRRRGPWGSRLAPRHSSASHEQEILRSIKMLLLYDHKDQRASLAE